MLACLHRVFADGELRQELLDNALHIVEVHLVSRLVPGCFMAPAADKARQLHTLLGQFGQGQCLGQEHRRHIEIAQIQILAGEVAHRIFHDAGE